MRQRNVFFTRTNQCLDLDAVIAIERQGFDGHSRVMFRLSSGANIESEHDSSEAADEELADASYLMQCPLWKSERNAVKANNAVASRKRKQRKPVTA